MEETPGNFLACPDLGEGAIDRLGHVDLEGLLICFQVDRIEHGEFLEKPTHSA